MDTNDPASAVRALERAIETSRPDAALLMRLADAHRVLFERADAEAELAAICRDLPFAFTSQLHLARLRDIAQDFEGAVLGYTRAIKTAQLRGYWFDEGSTPPWIKQLVLFAMEAAHHGRHELFRRFMEPRRARYGADELARVSKCVAMYLGLEPLELADPRQRPSFLYFPGLPVAPVFPRDALPFAEAYEAQTDAIAAEMLRVRDGDGVQPFHYDVPEADRGKLTAGASWDAYFFYCDGVRDAAHHDACPATSAALAALPLDQVRDHGPEVCFSIMRPGAHILPHRGVTNTRAVLHLGLEIPDGCALHLPGVLEQHWQRGACFAFDDTFEHEAWNRSDRTRVILLGDIWNPYLRPAEREVIAELVPYIGDFNRAVAPAPRTP